MRYFPVFLDLAAGPVVLVGSDLPAAAKLRLLRAANARVRWYRNDATCEGSDPMVEVFSGVAPEKVDLSDAIAVVSAAGDAADEQVCSSVAVVGGERNHAPVA